MYSFFNDFPPCFMVPLLQIVILKTANSIFRDKTLTTTYKENMDQNDKNIQRLILFGVFR